MKFKIAIVLGTRPEIIKLSSIIRECQKKKIDFFIIHTNQHYSIKLDKIFFRDLELLKPKYNLGVGSGSHGEQTAKMMVGIEKILLEEKPDVILIQGDTNTVLAGGLAASKIGIKVGHVEAGLRSYDRTMPEEINRVVVDHVSDFLFVPTKDQAQILKNEAINANKIFVVGNTIVDAVKENKKIAAKKSKILFKLKIKPKDYFLLTMHRPSNVDSKNILKSLFKTLEKIYQKYKLPIIFPIHPRTKSQLEKFKLFLPEGIVEIEPVGFLDFLELESNARLILTDSGGVQEEACILKVPSITLRENTERPETIKVGASILAGHNEQKIILAVKKMLLAKNNWSNPFGDGQSGKKIINILKKIHN